MQRREIRTPSRDSLSMATAYIGLLMKYIENEEDWLFPQANRLLKDDADRELVGEFQKTGAEMTCDRCREPYIASPIASQIILACQGRCCWIHDVVMPVQAIWRVIKPFNKENFQCNLQTS